MNSRQSKLASEQSILDSAQNTRRSKRQRFANSKYLSSDDEDHDLNKFRLKHKVPRSPFLDAKKSVMQTNTNENSETQFDSSSLAYLSCQFKSSSPPTSSQTVVKAKKLQPGTSTSKSSASVSHVLPVTSTQKSSKDHKFTGEFSPHLSPVKPLKDITNNNLVGRKGDKVTEKRPPSLADYFLPHDDNGSNGENEEEEEEEEEEGNERSYSEEEEFNHSQNIVHPFGNRKNQNCEDKSHVLIEKNMLRSILDNVNSLSTTVNKLKRRQERSILLLEQIANNQDNPGLSRSADPLLDSINENLVFRDNWPLQTEEDLKEEEAKLNQSSAYRDKFLDMCLKQGDAKTTVQQWAYNICQCCLSNEIGVDFSWCGLRGNKKFSKFQMAKLMRAAVTQKFSKEADKTVDAGFMNWFRYANTRLKRSQAKLGPGPEGHGDEEHGGEDPQG